MNLLTFLSKFIIKHLLINSPKKDVYYQKMQTTQLETFDTFKNLNNIHILYKLCRTTKEIMNLHNFNMHFSL